MVRKLIGALIAGIAVLAFANSAHAQSVLKNAYMSTSNSVAGQSGVTHTFTFYHPGSTFGSATFQYCTQPSGSTCSDTSIDVDTPAEDVVTEGGGDDAGNWAVNGSPSVSQGIETNATTADTDANNVWVFGFSSIDNPAFGSSACTASSNSSTRTCYVRVRTYAGTNVTTLSGSTTLSTTLTQSVTVTATVDPSFSLIISGVRQAQTATANGTTLTSTVTPTVTTIPFGNLTPGTEKFAAQSATVTTNAFGGYTISARMNANMTGSAYGDDIDGFVGNAATTAVSAAWTVPTGTTSGTNTGWLGVGTDDTDVSGQGGAASDQFFTLGTGNTTLSNQSTSAQSELDIYVFGIEVNSYQRADSYTGVLRYNALPVY